VDLVGTWTGIKSNGTTERYVFGADATFDVGTVNSADGFSSQLQGTFSVADQLLTLDMKSTDGVGNPIRLQITSEPYVNSTVLCDQPLRSDNEGGVANGIVGSWGSTATTQQLDLSGTPTEAPLDNVAWLNLSADGTFESDDNATPGTYTVDQDTVTTTFSSNGVSAVRSYTFVDGTVLCDPVFRK